MTLPGFSTPALDDIYVEVAEGVVQVVPPSIRPTLGALTLLALALLAVHLLALRARPSAQAMG